MKKPYAIVEGGVVVNIAVSESALGNNWIQSDTAKKGDLYNGEDFTTPPPPDPTDEELKMAGVSINGVMCSATRDDQNGLLAVARDVEKHRAAEVTYPGTVFNFENGNDLTITDANFDAIEAAWSAFRRSFFSIPE